MRYEYKSVGIWSLAKVSFFLNLVLGFLLGILYALFLPLVFAAMRMMPGADLADDAMGGSMAVLLVILPIFFALFCAVVNTIMVVIAAAIYNLVARLVGGIEFDLEPVAAATVPVTAVPPVPRPAPAMPPPPPSARPAADDQTNWSHLLRDTDEPQPPRDTPPGSEV